MDISELKDLANNSHLSPEDLERVHGILANAETQGGVTLAEKNELLSVMNTSLNLARKEDAQMESMENLVSKIEALNTN